MSSTTVKVSAATWDRIRSFGGETHEATIVAALDVLEEKRFWAQADEAATWRRTLPVEQRTALAESDAEIDSAFDAVE